MQTPLTVPQPIDKDRERCEDYYALPLWSQFLAAKATWEQAQADYSRGAQTDADFMRLHNAECAKDELLELLRQTPEHLAAFGPAGDKI
jgi:hypothetical protein